MKKIIAIATVVDSDSAIADKQTLSGVLTKLKKIEFWRIL
jgi:hypothetical protein